MKSGKLYFLASTFISLSILILPAHSFSAGKHTIKMATLAPEGSPWMDAWSKAVTVIESGSPVPIDLIVYAGGVMGDEPDLVRRLKLDQLQIIGVSVSGIAKLVPELLVLGLPFLFQNYEEVDHIVGKFLTRFQDYAKQRGFTLFNFSETGLVSTFSVNNPQKLADYRQQSVWIWSSDPIGLKMADLLEVNGVLLGVPEVRVALQTGMIDTVFGTPSVLVAMQWQDHVNYHYPEPVAYSPAVVIGTNKVFDRLPAHARIEFDTLFRKTLNDRNKDFIQNTRRKDQEIAGMLKNSGIKTVAANPYIYGASRVLAGQVWDELAGEYYPANLLEDIKSELKTFRQQKMALEICP